jgi:hypothetical protein
MPPTFERIYRLGLLVIPQYELAQDIGLWATGAKMSM